MARSQKDAVDLLYKEFVAGDRHREAFYETALQSAAIARELYDMRHKAGISQRELARRVGTSPSVISRIENDDYEGHSMSLLRRVAAALGCRVQVSLVPMAADSSARKRRKSA